MQVSFGGVYLIRGSSLNAGFDPQVERAVRRIRKEAARQHVEVADIRTQRAGLPSRLEGAVTQEVRAVFTADDAKAARPLIEQINGKVRDFRRARLNSAEINTYVDWWRNLNKVIREGVTAPGVAMARDVNRALTRGRLDVVSGLAPAVLPTEVMNPALAKSRAHAVHLNDPPARQPGLLSRGVSWLREKLV